MEKITFKNIHTLGHIIVENNLYRQYHYPEMLIRYDSNFLEFKTIPTLSEFTEAANYLRTFHLKHGQKHVKFTFPENEKLSKELTQHLKESDYQVGFLELYAIQPEQFPKVEYDPGIKVEKVSDDNFETFLTLNYEQDLQFGEEFAKQKVDLYKHQLYDPAILQLIAYYKGSPAGSVDILIADDTVEIDGLDVKESLQRKGVGSRLQQFVMKTFSDKSVILVADGEDTPREMYQRQNYRYLGFRHEAQKVSE